jgi:hypothetical protein
MKKLLYLSILTFVFYTTNFAQETKVVAAPVKDAKPFIVTKEQFENLEIPAQIDRFGKLDDKQKKFHLDLFTNIISSENKTVEFVIQLNGKNKDDVNKNMEFIYNYLTKTKKITSTRISFAVIEESDNDVELWLVPNKKLALPTYKKYVMISAENEEELGKYFQVKKSKKNKN